MVLLIAGSAPAFARVATGSSGGHFQTRMFDGQKYANKERVQWTLADWLAQKSKMALADQWLAMNRSAEIFEFNAGAAHNKYTLKTTDAAGAETEIGRDAQVYHLDIWVTIFNLFGEYEKTSDDRESWGGGAGLRIFGSSSQSTSIFGRYGWRKQTFLASKEVWENLWAEGDLQIYVFKFFGLHGKYRKTFPSKSNLSTTMESTRSSGGAFIEFQEFRIFGDVYQEPTEYKDASGVITKEERSGYEAGLRIHF